MAAQNLNHTHLSPSFAIIQSQPNREPIILNPPLHHQRKPATSTLFNLPSLSIIHQVTITKPQSSASASHPSAHGNPQFSYVPAITNYTKSVPANPITNSKPP
jgi:hypothetical protein